MSFQSGGNGGRPGMMSEINVTPLVDVMLVLLIIFMVAAPMMTQGMDVNLPQVDNKTIPTEDTQTILTIRVDGTVEYDKMTLRMEDMAFQVKGFMDAKGSKMVLIRADKDTSYGNVAQVMSRLQQAGITSVGLVTEPIDRTRNSAPSGKPNRS